MSCVVLIKRERERRESGGEIERGRDDRERRKKRSGNGKRHGTREREREKRGWGAIVSRPNGKPAAKGLEREREREVKWSEREREREAASDLFPWVVMIPC